MFLLPSINLRLRPTILNMKPGTRVVSNSFTMDDWQADATTTVEGDCTTLVHGLPVDRAGEGRGHLAARLEHADADAEVPDAHRHAGLDRDLQRHAATATEITFSAGGTTYTGHGQRQLDEGHHRRRHRLDRDEEVGRLGPTRPAEVR